MIMSMEMYKYLVTIVISSSSMSSVVAATRVASVASALVASAVALLLRPVALLGRRALRVEKPGLLLVALVLIRVVVVVTLLEIE
jgi:hypothetical protein